MKSTNYNLNVKKNDAGIRQVKEVVRSGGTDYPGAAQALSTSYVLQLQVAIRGVRYGGRLEATRLLQKQWISNVEERP